tara:strand:- start:1084 stop:1521 length:438 start_codon:yes stop_codon:yes gene_type:complete
MAIHALAHVSIRTHDLDASEFFYVELMGFRRGTRPPFNFPGRWIYFGDDESNFGVVHLIGMDHTDKKAADKYLGSRSPEMTEGSGVIDHIAFNATGWQEMRARLCKRRVAYEERTVPDLGLHQVFFADPSGIVIELNYPASEAGQ